MFVVGLRGLLVKKIRAKRIKVFNSCNQAAGIVLLTTRTDLLVKLSKHYLNPMS